MARIFISYRRQDSPSTTGRIYDQLESAFGSDKVFRDINDIDAGQDFRAKITQEIDQCDILLVIIGPKWETITDSQGNRRLDNPNDFVRLEIEAGLKDPKKVVIPVLAENAPMPNPDTLPKSLRELCYRNAVNIRQDPDFHSDMHKLIGQIRKIGKASTQTSPRIPILIGAGVLGVALIAIFATWPHPPPYPTPAVSLTVPSPSALPTPIQPSETVSPIAPSPTVPSPTISPTPIRLVQTVKVTLVKFTCQKVNDGWGDPAGDFSNNPDIDRLKVGLNAYDKLNTTAGGTDQLIKIPNGSIKPIDGFGNATPIYWFEDSEAGWQPSKGEAKFVGEASSIYIQFNTDPTSHDYEFARIDFGGYARDYDFAAGNSSEHSSGRMSISWRDFFANGGVHTFLIDGSDVTLEVEVKIELVD